MSSIPVRKWRRRREKKVVMVEEAMVELRDQIRGMNERKLRRRMQYL